MSTSTKSLKRTKKRAAVVIMGAGKLGEALLSLGTFPGREFRVVAIFDVDPKQVGKRFPRSLVVEPCVQLANRVSTHNVQRGIIAVPSSTAQQAADALVSAGVKMILNYASADLRVPFGVIVSRIPDPAAQFARLMSTNSPPSLPWKMQNPIIATTAMGLARMPQMWTESTHWGLSNPILQSLVDAQQLPVAAAAAVIKQEGFFEYTQRVQATPPAQVPAAQQPSLVGLDFQLEAMREILLVEDDALRTRGILVWGPAGCGKSALVQRLAREEEDKLDMFIVREDTELQQAFHSASSRARKQRRSVVVLENIHQLCKSRAFKSALISICDNAQFDAICIIATSNAPWALDVNMLRHFENRISVPLPSAAQRTRILESYFTPQAMPAAEFACVGRQLDLHSSWDVITTAKRAGLLAKKMGESLARAHFIAAQQQQAPTFCKDMVPFFDSFANRFGAASFSGGEQHLSMYS